MSKQKDYNCFTPDCLPDRDEIQYQMDREHWMTYTKTSFEALILPLFDKAYCVESVDQAIDQMRQDQSDHAIKTSMSNPLLSDRFPYTTLYQQAKQRNDIQFMTQISNLCIHMISNICHVKDTRPWLFNTHYQREYYTLYSIFVWINQWLQSNDSRITGVFIHACLGRMMYTYNLMIQPTTDSNPNTNPAYKYMGVLLHQMGQSVQSLLSKYVGHDLVAAKTKQSVLVSVL